MDTVLQKQLDRLEIALTKLLDSITTYNPSLPAAHDLLAVEEDLSKGLEQRKFPIILTNELATNNVVVAQHQANYNRIQLLRQTAETLDNQIKSTITTLAETRKELLNTPFTTFPESSHAVS